MKDNFLKLVLVLIVVSLTALACGFSVSTANFADAYMAKDADGNERTTVFAAEDVFYAIVDLANAPDDTVVRAVWFVVNAEGEEPNTMIDDVSITSGDSQLSFDLTNQEGFIWPVGEYRVDLYLNDELKTSLSFEVQ